MGPQSREKRGPRMLGRYVLHNEIASGGMAAVHYGQLSGPVGFSRGVAIKRLHAQFARDPEFVTMFLDEARLAARIRHPNVVQTLDVVTLEGEIFIVLEYIAGEALSRLSRLSRARGELVPLNIAVAVMTGVLHGLHGAHEATDDRGVPLDLVHRDVSPQNVMVGIDGIARVLDFGVAKAAGRLQTTRDGNLKGKVAYMAPEQLASKAVTRRSDVYATSVVLWELFTGKRLFESDSEAGLITMVLNPSIVSPRTINPEVSEALDALVMKGLARNPDDRFPTAREMALLLEKNGGLTSPSEVGAWVQGLAGDALGKRAAFVAEIESHSSRDVTAHAQAILAELETGSSSTGAAPKEGDTRVSVQVDLAPMESEITRAGERKRARRLTVLAVAIGAAGVLTAGVVIGRWNDKPRGSGTQVLEEIDAGMAVSSPLPILPSAHVDPVLLPDASALGVPVSAPSSSATPSVTPPTGTTPPVIRPRPKPLTPAHPAKDDCDPPYTLDAQGHKLWKRNCL